MAVNILFRRGGASPANCRKWAAAGKRLLSSSSDTPHHRNHLADFSELKNVYCAVRHGESLANVEGIISCEPDTDSGYFHGLSPKGKEQVKELGSKLLSLIPDIESRRVFIYASDFRRARDTSRAIPSGLWAAAESVVVSFPEYIPALRERSFGPDLNLGSDARYKEVWEADAASAADGSGGVEGVETVQSVQDRATKFVAELEARHGGGGDGPGSVCVLVSHGDLLQILQTGFERTDPRLHRSLSHLETCGARLLQLK